MDILSGFGTILIVLFAVIAILAPIWLYLINVYTGASRDELKKIRKQLEIIVKRLDNPIQADRLPKNTKPGWAETVCPHCGKKTEYPNRYSGQNKPCPKCNQTIELS